MHRGVAIERHKVRLRHLCYTPDAKRPARPDFTRGSEMEPLEIKALIEGGLPESVALVTSPDNTHFEAVVVSDSFEHKSRLARHQLVYQCLGPRVGNEIHALSIRAFTAEEWEQQPE